MLISASHKFIFIHIPKTAGTTLTSAFTASFGNDLFPSRARVHESAIVTKNQTKEWDSYFSCAFIRNPWDRLVSLYTSRPDLNTMSFNEYLHNDIVSQSSYVMDNNDILVNVIGRFESLQDNYQFICQMTGVSPLTLPHLNPSKHDNYRTYYDAETKALVADKCSEDIERFGYSW